MAASLVKALEALAASPEPRPEARARESPPRPAMSVGVSFTSSETASATSRASTTARRGRCSASHTSAATLRAKSSASFQPEAMKAAERWSRWPKSPSSEPGPPPTAWVTWLEPPSAASIPINANAAATTTAAATPTAHGARSRAPLQQRERQETCEVGDHVPAVRADRAHADARRHRQRDRRQSARAGERAEHERGREEQRRDLVVDPVEAPAAVRPGAERGEAVPARLRPQSGEEENEQRDQPERQRQPGPQQHAAGERQPRRAQRERDDRRPSPRSRRTRSAASATTEAGGAARKAARPRAPGERVASAASPSATISPTRTRRPPMRESCACVSRRSKSRRQASGSPRKHATGSRGRLPRSSASTEGATSATGISPVRCVEVGEQAVDSRARPPRSGSARRCGASPGGGSAR